MEIPRRALFTWGFWRAPSSRTPTGEEPTTPPQSDSARTESSPQQAPLPTVIAWLAPHLEGNTAAEIPTSPSRREGTIPLLRPPGAVAERTFLARCTQGGACIEACPHGSLRPAPLRYRESAGTPYLDPLQQPCWLCEDLPCIAACPTGALHLDGDRMGLARIEALHCLNQQGMLCESCLERCPVPGALLQQAGGPPRVDEALCTGCGVCQHVCPAPQNAVILLPNRVRRTPEPGASP